MPQWLYWLGSFLPSCFNLRSGCCALRQGFDRFRPQFLRHPARSQQPLQGSQRLGLSVLRFD